MSHRRTPRSRADVDVDPEPQTYAWIVYAVGLLLVGGLAGYMLSLAARPDVGTVAWAGTSGSLPSSPPSSSGMVDEDALEAYRRILRSDATNVTAAVEAGNLLYDAKRYEEAIPYYQQALAVNGSDVNVSTDLGTALWYTGRADAALAQYAVSLSVDPGHAQTLFNIGIVRSDGKRDYAGAVQAWETLLARNPSYDRADDVRRMIADARSKLGTGN